MRTLEKKKTLELRRLGRSYGSIAKELGLSKGTIAYWLKDFGWSQELKDRLSKENNLKSRERYKRLGLLNRARWLLEREEKRIQARDEFPRIKTHPLFIPSLMLYWAEGDSDLKGGNVRLTNTDPRMVKLFIVFARDFLKVPMAGIKVGLILYPDLDEAKCVKFWSGFTGVPKSNFHKVQFIRGRHPTKRLENGICSVRIVGGVGLKEKIYCWIELIYQDLVR